MKSGDHPPRHAHTALKMEAPPGPRLRVLPVSSAIPASLSRHPLQCNPCIQALTLACRAQGAQWERSSCGCRGQVTSSLSLTPPEGPGPCGVGQTVSASHPRGLECKSPMVPVWSQPMLSQTWQKTVSLDSSPSRPLAQAGEPCMSEGWRPAAPTLESPPVPASQPERPEHPKHPGPMAPVAQRAGSPT